METTDNGYKNKNMRILRASKAAVTSLDNYLINSKLVLDYPKSLMKPASTILHNKYKHQGIEGKELVRGGSGHPTTGPERV